MKVLHWYTFYANGTMVSDEDASPEELDGIVGIVQVYEECTACNPPRNYKDLIVAADWYLWDGERWSHVPCHPIPGRWVEREDVEALHPDKVLVKSAPGLSDSKWQALRSVMAEI